MAIATRKWPFHEMAICLHQTLFLNRNYVHWLAARSALLSLPRSTFVTKKFIDNGKDRAQWDNIKDAFMIQHLLKATQ